MRCGRKISKGFEVGSERFNLATITAGSVLSAECNPLGADFGSFTLRDLPLSALGFKTADVLRETFGNFPGAAELYSRADGSLRFGEADRCNVPVGLRFPEVPESADGPGSPAVMLYASPAAADNLRFREFSAEIWAEARRAAAEPVPEVPPGFTVQRAETILPPLNPNLATLDEIAAGRYLPETPAEYDRSPFRGDTSPEIPSARGVVSEIPAEVPAVPCAETVPAPAETSDNPDAGMVPETFACPCGKSYAHRRSLSRHARTCPEAAAV